MKQFMRAESFFTYASYYLPELLAHFDVTPKELTDLRIGTKPDLLRLVLIAYLRIHNQDKPAKIALIKHRSRFDHDHPTARTRRCQDMLAAAASGEQNKFLLDLQHWLTKVIEDAELYKSDDGYKSQIVGGFSYEPDENQEYAENYRTVECPHCYNEETVLGQGIEEVIEGVTLFTHLSGPYCRCDECEKVIRPLVYQPDEAPYDLSNVDDEAWEFYSDRLDDLVTGMVDHLETVGGYSRPYQLRVDVGNADWRGRDAYAICEVDGVKLADTMRVNSQFNIHAGKVRHFQNGTVMLSCFLAHHDATSSITVTPVWECELNNSEERYISQDELPRAQHNAKIADVLLCGSHAVFEYSRGSMSLTSAPLFDLASTDGLVEGLECLQAQLDCEDWEGLAEQAELLPIQALLSAIGRMLDELIAEVKNVQATPSLDRVLHLRALIDCYLAHEGDDE